MRKKTFQIPMVGSLNTRIDPRLAVVPTLQTADNVYRTRTGEWAKRHGYTALPAAYDSPSGATIDRVRQMAGRMDELIVLDTRRFWTWNAQTQKFVDLARFVRDQTLVTHEIDRINDNPTGDTYSLRTPLSALETDVAFGANTAMYAWVLRTTLGTKTHAVFFSANDATTKQMRVPVTDADPTSTPGGHRNPRCVFAEGFFMVFYVQEDAAASLLKVIGYNPTTGAIRALVTVVSDLMGTGTGTPFYDAYVRPDNGNVVIAYRSSASTLKALEWDPTSNTASIAAVTVVASDVASNGLCWLDTEASVTNPRLVTVVNGATGIVRRVLLGTTLAENSSITVQASPGDVSAITGVYKASTDTDTIWWQVEHATDVEQTRVSGARVISGTPNIDNNHTIGALASKMFRVTPTGAPIERLYVLIRQPWKAQGTYMLSSANFGESFSGSRAIVGRMLRGKTDHLPARRNALSAVAAPTTTQRLIAGTEIYDFTTPAGVRTPANRPLGIGIEFSGRVPPPVPFSTQLFVPGSMPRIYGGHSIAEAGHQVDPTSFAAIVDFSSGSLSAGTYQYTQLFCHRDNEGRIWRSGPGEVGSITLGVGRCTSLTIRKPFVINRSHGDGFTWVEIYRTKANGTVFFRLPLTTDSTMLQPSAATLVATDSFADADIEDELQLYAGGGELFNSPPPPCSGAVVQGARIVVIDAERPTRVAASKEFQTGQGSGWHDDLAVDIQGDGPNTALALIEGRVIVFKRQAIYLVTGDWPDANGIGPLPLVQKIATGWGTVEPESVCQVTDGVWFKDPKKGLCFIDRGLQVTQPGKPVQSSDPNDIVAATIVEEFEHVRFLTANGACPQYDYFEKQWSTFFGSAVITNRTAATLAGGIYYISSGGSVYFYDNTQFDDNGSLIFGNVVMRFSFAGIEAVQRINRIHVIGAMIDESGGFTARLLDDYGGSAFVETKDNPGGVKFSNPNDPGAVAPGTFSVEMRPRNPRTTSQTLQIFWPSANAASPLTAGIRISAVAVEVGLRDTPGLRRLPARNRV